VNLLVPGQAVLGFILWLKTIGLFISLLSVVQINYVVH